MRSGFGFPVGFVATTAVIVAAIAAGATRYPLLALVPLTAVVVVVAALATARAAFGVAAFAWAAHSGFVLGRAGELVFGPRALTAAALLVAAAALTAAAGAVVRHLRAGRPLPRIPAPRAPEPIRQRATTV
ncbi:hypothetical protein [Amycolatopsis sp. CA-230715]|uniref:hypothetical protein n=1 Tax=Amycolatopsis sp. CA-230715 TaxID=2745196 RepID=UPI001C0372E4|nr:hypothetical protein [Amycolatopsis sp. CA-230715]